MPPNDFRSLAESLSKLWPHRGHESNYLKNLFCYFGLHRWSRQKLGSLHLEKNVRFCRWCPKIKIDRVIYGG
jgi:hypothetical protein